MTLDAKSCQGRVGVGVVGLKGETFLRALLELGLIPARVFAYDQADDRSTAFATIRSLAEAAGVEVVAGRRPDFADVDLLFLVGWQYLIAAGGDLEIVAFHDSLLPRYRGFSPTVAALVAGDAELGVTALVPIAGVDEGPIVGQARFPVVYPMKIADALRTQAALMATLAVEIVARWRTGAGLGAVEQDHALATYALWRDDEDYLIDWTRPAEEIARFVDAVGHPYAGARTMLNGDPVTVTSAKPLPDLRFDMRVPGKIWKLDGGFPVVVCGRGLLRLEGCLTPQGTPVIFNRVRVRLG